MPRLSGGGEQGASDDATRRGRNDPGVSRGSRIGCLSEFLSKPHPLIWSSWVGLRAVCAPEPAGRRRLPQRAKKNPSEIQESLQTPRGVGSVCAMTDEPELDSTNNDDRTPALNRNGFDCPRCGVWAHQVWVNPTEFLNSNGGGTVSRPVNVIPHTANQATSAPQSIWAPSEYLRIARCARCRGASVWVSDRMVFPSASPAPVAHPDMPDDARALYEEAASVFGVSRRAGAALARAALERLLRTADPVPGRVTLADRIDHVSNRVSTALDEMLAVVRHAGNQSLHVGDDADELLVLVLDPTDDEIAELIFIAINDVTDELVSKPKRMQGAFNHLPEEARARLAAARAKKP